MFPLKLRVKAGWGRGGSGKREQCLKEEAWIWADLPETIELASCTQFSLLNSLSALAPGGYCPETHLFEGIFSHPRPLLEGARQSFLAGKSPTSLLGCKLWVGGIVWATRWLVYMLTSNNRMYFGGIFQVNSYFKFMGVVVCWLTFKGTIVI